MTTIYCPVHEQHRFLDVCTELCHRRREGKLDRQHSKCSAAIGKRKCPVVNELYPPRKRKEKV